MLDYKSNLFVKEECMQNKKKYVSGFIISVSFLLLAFVLFFVGGTTNTDISYDILKTTHKPQFSTSSHKYIQYIYTDMYIYNNTPNIAEDVTLEFVYKTTQNNIKTTEMVFSKLKKGQNYVSNEKFDYITLSSIYDSEKFNEIVSVRYRIGENEYINAKEHESISALRASSYLVFAGAGLCTAISLILILHKDPHPKKNLPESSVIVVNTNDEKVKVEKQKNIELERENLELKTEIHSLKTKMVVCSYCGKKNTSNADSCKHCGAPIK